MESFLYILFLGTLIVTTLNPNPTRTNVYLIVAFGIIYLLLEAYEIIVTTRTYFKDLSNWNDLAGPLLIFFYFIYVEITGEKILWALSLLNLHAFFKGLSFFTVSKNLRFFLRFLK